MPVLKLLGGLGHTGRGEQRVAGGTVRAVLEHVPVPRDTLLPGGRLNADIEVLVNGRNIAFLSELETPVSDEDRVAVFFHGVRGYPGG